MAIDFGLVHMSKLSGGKWDMSSKILCGSIRVSFLSLHIVNIHRCKSDVKIQTKCWLERNPQLGAFVYTQAAACCPVHLP